MSGYEGKDLAVESQLVPQDHVFIGNFPLNIG